MTGLYVAYAPIYAFDSRFDVVRCQSLMLFFRLAAASKIAFGLRSACSDHVHLAEILQANPES